MLVFSGMLIKNTPALIGYLAGAYLVPVAGLIFYGPVFGDTFIYKFQIGTFISAACFALVSIASHPLRKWLVFAPFVAGLLAFIEDSRALAGVTILAAIITAVEETNTARGIVQQNRFHKRNIYTMLGVISLSSIFLFLGYRKAAATGLLGERAQEKYEMQANLFDSANFSILSGRNEILFVWPKVLASPLIGYGSWAKDWNYVYDRAEELGLNAEDITRDMAINEPGLIPAHSHIFGAWLEAGIFGAIFWAVVFWRTVRLIVLGWTKVAGRITPVMTFALVGFAWDLLFSPYGAERRIWDGFILAWIAWAEDCHMYGGQKPRKFFYMRAARGQQLTPLADSRSTPGPRNLQ
jgi:hypothetical protein